MVPGWLIWAYYLTGGPALAILGAWGLWQLAIAKRNNVLTQAALEIAREDMNQRLASDRTRLAVDMCLRYSETVLPLIDEAMESLIGSPLPARAQDRSPWDLESYAGKKVGGPKAAARVRKGIAALNAMEAVAIPLASGAADAELARASIGMSFVEAAANLSFLVAHQRSQGRCTFPAIRVLCDGWSAEIATVENPETRLLIALRLGQT